MTTHHNVGKHDNQEQPKKRKRGRPKCLKVSNVHQTVIPVLPKTTIQTSPIVVSSLPPQVLQLIDSGGNLVSLQQNKSMGHPNIINLALPVTTVGSLLLPGTTNKDGGMLGGMVMNTTPTVVTTTTSTSPIIIINKPSDGLQQTLTPTPVLQTRAAVESTSSPFKSSPPKQSNSINASPIDEKAEQSRNQPRRDREVHNAEEKRRKAKINSWIAKLGVLLSKFPSEKQNKTSILERAFEYINQKEKKGTQIHSEPKMLLLRIKNLEAIVIMLVDLLKQHSVPVPENVQIIKVDSRSSENSSCSESNRPSNCFSNCPTDICVDIPSTTNTTVSTNKVVVEINNDNTNENISCNDKIVLEGTPSLANTETANSVISNQKNGVSTTISSIVETSNTMPMILNASAVKDIKDVAKLSTPLTTNGLLSAANKLNINVSQNFIDQCVDNGTVLLQNNVKGVPVTNSVAQLPVASGALNLCGKIRQNIVAGKMEMQSSFWRPISSILTPTCSTSNHIKTNSVIDNDRLYLSSENILNNTQLSTSVLNAANSIPLSSASSNCTKVSNLSNNVTDQKDNFFIDINSTNLLSNKIIIINPDLMNNVPFSNSISNLNLSSLLTSNSSLPSLQAVSSTAKQLSNNASSLPNTNTQSFTVVPLTSSSNPSQLLNLTPSSSLVINSLPSLMPFSTSPTPALTSISSSTILSISSSTSLFLPVSNASPPPLTPISSSLPALLPLSTGHLVPISTTTSSMVLSATSTLSSTTLTPSYLTLPTSYTNTYIGSSGTSGGPMLVSYLPTSSCPSTTSILPMTTTANNTTSMSSCYTNIVSCENNCGVFVPIPDSLNSLNKAPIKIANKLNIKSSDDELSSKCWNAVDINTLDVNNVMNANIKIVNENIKKKTRTHNSAKRNGFKPAMKYITEASLSTNKTTLNNVANTDILSSKSNSSNDMNNKNQVFVTAGSADIPLQGFGIDNLLIITSSGSINPVQPKKQATSDTVAPINPNDLTNTLPSTTSITPQRKSSIVVSSRYSPIKSGVVTSTTNSSRSRLSSAGHTVASLLDTACSLNELESPLKSNSNEPSVKSTYTVSTVNVTLSYTTKPSCTKITNISTIAPIDLDKTPQTSTVASNSIKPSSKHTKSTSNSTSTSTLNSRLFSSDKIASTFETIDTKCVLETSAQMISTTKKVTKSSSESIGLVEIASSKANTSTVSSTKRWGNVVENAHNSNMLVSIFTLGNRKRAPRSKKTPKSKKKNQTNNESLQTTANSSGTKTVTSSIPDSIDPTKTSQMNLVNCTNSQTNLQNTANTLPTYSEAIALNAYTTPNSSTSLTSTNDTPKQVTFSKTLFETPSNTSDCNWVIKSSVSLAPKSTENSVSSGSGETVSHTVSMSTPNSKSHQMSLSSVSIITTSANDYAVPLQIKSGNVRTMKDRTIRNKWLEMENNRNNDTTLIVANNDQQVDQCASPVISFPNRGRKRSTTGATNDREVKRIAQCSVDIDDNSSHIFSAESLCQSAIHKEDDLKTCQTNVRLNKPETNCNEKDENEMNNSLPTILNIFAPAPVPISSSNQSSLATGISNFTAESLVNNECNVNLVGNNITDSTFHDPMLMGGNSQLFTNFSADTLISDNESGAAYTDEGMINQNNVNQMSHYWNNTWLPQEMSLNDFQNPSNIQNNLQRQQQQHSRTTLHTSTECSPIKSIMSILSTPNNNQNLNFDNFNDNTINNVMLPHNAVNRFQHRNRNRVDAQMNLHNVSVNTSQWNKTHMNIQTSNKMFCNEPVLSAWNNQATSSHRSNRDQASMNSSNTTNMSTRTAQLQNPILKSESRSSKRENSGPMFGNYPLVSSGGT